MKNPYRKYFNENALWSKIGGFAKSAGQQVVYAVLLLFYMMKDPGTEVKKKLTIGAALGYFILPVDAVPDLTPILGFTDDLGVLIYALSQISSAITDDIRQKAKMKMHEWFRKVDDNQLMLLESRITGSEGNVL
ncbi:MAG TPA: hypothetical protein DCY35_06895 [Prolixibacteraceae bacterium]|nr:hypothetical protein [Prolixibacteraceae bacterium]